MTNHRSFLDRKMDRSLVLMLGLLVISRCGHPTEIEGYMLTLTLSCSPGRLYAIELGHKVSDEEWRKMADVYKVRIEWLHGEGELNDYAASMTRRTAP